MVPICACPDRQTLQRLVLGQLSADEVGPVESHLEDCSRCAETLQTLQQEDTLVHAVRSGSPLQAETDSAEVAGLMQRLESLNLLGGHPDMDVLPCVTPPPPEPSVATPLLPGEVTQDRLDFLAPPQEAGELGRLGGYHVLEVLGTGGMGIVLRAWDPALRRGVALKVLRPRVAAQAQARQRFLREAQAAAAIKSDHVVTIHQVSEDRGVPFLAMELLPGEALNVRLQRGGRLPVAEVVRVGREMAQGLVAAHERGVIHRDIKPGNVWLEEPTARVKLLDFGLARPLAEDVQLTRQGVLVGTPAYMAPEQARGEKVDARADLFALGCVFYQISTGQRPFSGENTMALLAALATTTPRPVGDLNPEVPAGLAELIHRLLEKEPDRRPESAQVVADALTAIERGLNDVQPEPAASPTRDARRWRRAAVAALAFFLLGALAVLTVVIIRDRQGKEVARVTVPEGGSVEVKDIRGGTVTGPQADREKPFALVRKGTEVTAFRTLAGLWEEHQAGDEIVIHGNGPFLLPPLDVSDRALVLRAGPGYHPVFHPDELVFDGTRQNQCIHLTRASAAIEGCDFLVRGLPQGVVGYPHLFGGGGDGPCILRNCRLWGLCLGNLATPSLTIEDCLLSSDPSGVVLLGYLPARCHVRLVNNLIFCGRLVCNLEPPGGQTLELSRNAVVGVAHELIFVRDGVSGVTITAENNLIDFTKSHASSSCPVARKGGFKELLRWQGNDNWYAGLDLKAWNAQLAEPEVNAHTVPALPFGWRTELPREADKALAWWQELLQAARKESGPNDLGPDVSLVGPGEAYLRGMAAEGRPVARADLRPEALAGGRVALLRGGKAVRGFWQLGQAFQAAQSGDVLEIRSDAVMEGGEVPEGRGALTLRAAAGYRPRLRTAIGVRPGTALAVEGLTFTQGHGLDTWWVKDLPLEKQARISRLANCAFDRRQKVFEPMDDVGTTCLFLSPDGSPGEVVRCVMQEPLGCRPPRGSHVRVKESLLGMGLRPLTGRKPNSGIAECAGGTVELDACALVWPDAGIGLSGQALFRNHTDEGACSWISRRCLLQSNAVLKVGGEEGPPLWTAERNLYRIGPCWVSGLAIFSLAQWRAFTTSPETGSVESQPPIADPRRWRLQAGSPASGAGPDMDRIGRPAP
jgi:hypothetical protein